MRRPRRYRERAFAVGLLWVPAERSARMMPHFLSFATGALLGAALLALLPEAIAGAGPPARTGSASRWSGARGVLRDREARAVVAPRGR